MRTVFSRQFPVWLIGAVYFVAVIWVFVHLTKKAAPKTTVRIAHWQVETGPSSGLDAVIEKYEDLHPEVRIEQLVIPPSLYKQWLRANLAGGTAPEILEYGSWLEGLSDVPVRYFEPLTRFLEKENPFNEDSPIEGEAWLTTFVDALYDQRVNSPEPGQYYAVTLTRGSLRLFCNLELLRKITGSDAVPKTMDDLRKLTTQVAGYRSAEERPLMLMAGSGFNASFLLNLYMAGATSTLREELDKEGMLYLYPRQILSSYLGGEWSFQRPELVAAFNLLEELDQLMRPGYMQLGRDEAAREFLRGDALFIFTGTWDATSLRGEASFPIGALRCPQLSPDDPIVGEYVLGRFADGNDITGFGVSLNKNAEHRDEAVRFMQFLTSYEGNRIFSEASGWPPSVKAVPMDAEIADLLSPADGYSNGVGFLSGGGNSRTLMNQNLHLLGAPQRGAEKFAEALDRKMRQVARADLEAIERDAWLAALPQDTRVASLGLLVSSVTDSDEFLLRRKRLEAAQNLSEARAMQIRHQLHQN